MFSLIKRLQVDWSLWLTLLRSSPTYPTLSWRWVCSLVWSSSGSRAEDRDPWTRWAVAGGMSPLLNNVPWGLQLCFTEGLSAGLLGWILRFYAGHSDFMVILLLGQMRGKGSVSRWRGDRMVFSSISGFLGRNGTPGRKHYVFANNLKKRGRI